MFEIDAYRRQRQFLLVLRGGLVARYCPGAKARLGGVFTPQIDHFYFDLLGLPYLDSAGLGVLVGLKMMANKNHTRLTFLSPSPRLSDIFRISKIDTIFDISNGDEAESIRSTLLKKENLLWQDSEQPDGESLTDAGSVTIEKNAMPISTSGEDFAAAKSSQEAVEYIKQGDYEKAIEVYQNVIELEPENLSALNNLGIVYEKQIQWYPEAMRTWERVRQVSLEIGDAKHADRAERHLDFLSKLIPNE